MEGFKYENTNKETVKSIEDNEEFRREKHLENIENVKGFVAGEGKLVTKIPEENEKESRIIITFKKVIIGTTIMISLWSMGKMDSSKVEASESNTQVEQQDDAIGSLLKMLDRMSPVLSATLERQSEIVEDAIDYSRISPYLEDTQESISEFSSIKESLEDNEEEQIKKIKNAGKLEILINTADDMIQIFDQMSDSQKGVFEKEGLTVASIKEVKETLEKYLR